MRNSNYIIFLVILIFSGACLYSHFATAKVYLLAPAKNKTKKREKNKAPSGILNITLLWKEPVIMNGISTEMEIGIAKEKFSLAAAYLKSMYPNSKIVGNKTSLLLEIKNSSSMRKKIFLVYTGKNRPLMIFSVILPAKEKEFINWPSDMPLPPNSKPLQIIEFPKRHAWYGMFSSCSSRDFVISSIDRVLKSNGWAVPEKNSTEINVSGVYIKKKPLRIMITSFSTNKKGETIGALYTKPLNGKP